jgi:hypothetical protein
MSVPSSEPPNKLSRWPLAAAALVPFALYVWTAGGTAYWLDSAEFTAAAIDLDIPHPPGHPLANLWGNLFTWLPLGPLPFRVALSQAAACAVALACVQRAVERSVAFLGVLAPTSGLIGLGSTWLLAGSYGFWFQSVRAEVYALQAMLVCFALERLSLLATRDPADTDARPFYQATLAVGLGLANHHLIAVLALPAFLGSFVMLTRAQGLRPLLLGTTTGLLGLSAYVYLPLRARHLPPMDLGHPVSAEALAWVVSARVYAKKVGTAARQPLDERFADLSVILVENLWVPTLLLMALGSYVLLRQRRTWALAFLWLVTAVVSLAGRAFLNEVRANPDVLGYMMPGFAAAVALAATGLGALTVRLKFRAAGPLAAALALGVGALALALGAPKASLAQFNAPDVFDEIRYRALPDKACVVLVAPQTAFRHFGVDAAERLRPDVAMLPVPFLDYGESGKQLARKRPELAPVIKDFLSRQQLSRSALTALIPKRRVLVELDTSVTLPFVRFLLPSGLYYELLPQPPSRQAIVQAAQIREATYDFLYRAIGADARELETKRQLLWLHYTDTVYFAQHGLRKEARRAAARGLRLEPQARELAALDRALSKGQGPLDVRPFLVGN